MLHYILAQVSIHVFQKAISNGFFRMATDNACFGSGGSGSLSTGFFPGHVTNCSFFFRLTCCTHHWHSARQLGINKTNRHFVIAISAYFPSVLRYSFQMNFVSRFLSGYFPFQLVLFFSCSLWCLASDLMVRA